MVLAVRPAIFNRYILAHDVPGFAQALAVGTHTVPIGVRRTAVEHPNHRRWCLLPSGGQRPRHGAPQHPDELPPPHAITSDRSGPRPILLQYLWIDRERF